MEEARHPFNLLNEINGCNPLAILIPIAASQEQSQLLTLQIARWMEEICNRDKLRSIGHYLPL